MCSILKVFVYADDCSAMYNNPLAGMAGFKINTHLFVLSYLCAEWCHGFSNRTTVSAVVVFLILDRNVLASITTSREP